MKPSKPMWMRIAKILTRRIENGKYPPGSKFPSQIEFCKEFGVSRITMTRVAIELKSSGLIEGGTGITRVRRK